MLACSLQPVNGVLQSGSKGEWAEQQPSQTLAHRLIDKHDPYP